MVLEVCLVDDLPGAFEAHLGILGPSQERGPAIHEGDFLALFDVPISSAEACAHEGPLYSTLCRVCTRMEDFLHTDRLGTTRCAHLTPLTPPKRGQTPHGFAYPVA